MSPEVSHAYYGKYRGVVLDNIDPLQIGRLLVTVPDVAGIIPSSWAMPCVPMSGINTGILAVPIIGAGVWVEFEQGNPDYPVWVGGFWGDAAEVPAASHVVPPGVPGITLQTPLMNGIVISDAPGIGGITMTTTTGAMISITEVGIMISNGQGAVISMLGPTVDINVGALTVI
jgi:Type VI secretion system/phage-baseplate injector OB domain